LPRSSPLVVAELFSLDEMSALKELSQFGIDVVVCLVLGAIVGWLCRGRIMLALILSIPASIGWIMLGAWYAATFSNQFSWQDPSGTVYWIGVPYLLFCLLPASGAALFVTIYWRCRRKKVS
jgi:hypothetical protein